MYIVFPIRFNRVQWCNGYLASLQAGDPGSIPVEGNIFLSSILFFPFLAHLSRGLTGELTG